MTSPTLGHQSFSGEDLATPASSLCSPGDTVGTVTMEATVVFQLKGTLEVDLSADVELDGSREAPPVTDLSTTEAPTTTAQVAATTAPLHRLIRPRVGTPRATDVR